MTKRAIRQRLEEEGTNPYVLNKMVNEVIQRKRNLLLFFVLAIFITASIYVIASGYTTQLEIVNSAERNYDDFLCQPNSAFICDKNNLLTPEERYDLLEEIMSTKGSIYKIYFYVDDGKTLLNTAKNAYSYTINNWKFSSDKHCDEDVIIICYNARLSQYMFQPTGDIVRNTHIFDMVNTTEILNSNSNIYFNYSYNFTVNTNKGFSFLFEDTPAKTYKAVFDYCNEKGYGRAELDNKLNNWYEASNNPIEIIFLGTLLSAIACFIVAGLTVAVSSSFKANRFKAKVYKIAKEINDKEEEAKKRERDRALIAKQLQEKAEEEQREIKRQAEEKKHPLSNLIKSISKIVSSNDEVNAKRDEVLERLEIIESIFNNEQPNNAMVNRFKNYYIDAFQENIDAILFHANKHSTNFDTEEEIPFLLKTFQTYLKIMDKFIDKSEAEGVQGIEINLKVLDQMASMDGLGGDDLPTI